MSASPAKILRRRMKTTLPTKTELLHEAYDQSIVNKEIQVIRRNIKVIMIKTQNICPNYC